MEVDEKNRLITAYDIAFSLAALLLFALSIIFPASAHGLRGASVGAASILIYLFACQEYFKSHIAGKRERMNYILMLANFLQRLSLIIAVAILIEYGFL